MAVGWLSFDGEGRETGDVHIREARSCEWQKYG